MCEHYDGSMLKLFMQGTVVTVGRARAVVISIGSKTAMGKIRDAISETADVSLSLFQTFIMAL